MSSCRQRLAESDEIQVDVEAIGAALAADITTRAGRLVEPDKATSRKQVIKHFERDNLIVVGHTKSGRPVGAVVPVRSGLGHAN